MQKFTIGEEADAQRELQELLDHNGFHYRREENVYRLLFTDRGRKWETVCVCRGRRLLLFGVYPIPVTDREAILSAVNEINGLLVQGAMFCTEDGVILRTSADLFDSYSAYESIARAMEYNANAMYRFWQQIAQAGSGDKQM